MVRQFTTETLIEENCPERQASSLENISCVKVPKFAVLRFSGDRRRLPAKLTHPVELIDTSNVILRLVPLEMLRLPITNIGDNI